SRRARGGLGGASRFQLPVEQPGARHLRHVDGVRRNDPHPSGSTCRRATPGREPCRWFSTFTSWGGPSVCSSTSRASNRSRTRRGVWLPGEAVNGPTPASDPVYLGRPFANEVFVVGGKNLHQLTRFRHWETDWIGLAGRHAFLNTRADPLGTNPMQLDQVFAVDTLGRDMRQVTQFRDVDPARECAGFPAGSCFTSNQKGTQDPSGRTVVFDSSCDAFDTGAVGEQLFAIDPHTFRLVQLNGCPGGCVVDPDGSLTVELPGPSRIASFGGRRARDRERTVVRGKSLPHAATSGKFTPGGQQRTLRRPNADGRARASGGCHRPHPGVPS